MPRSYANHSLNRQIIYAFVLQYRQEQQYAPSIREICTTTGIRSTATVHGHVRRMIRDGLITQANSKPRTLCAVSAKQLEANHG